MELKDVWARTTRDQIWRVVGWTLSAIVISVLPLLLGLPGFWIWSRSLSPVDFIIHGEAPIYSLGLLLGVLALTQKEMRVPFSAKSPCLWAAITLMLFAAALYNTIISGREGIDANGTGTSPNKTAVIALSLVCYVGSLALGFVVNWIHIVREQLHMEDLLSPEAGGGVDIPHLLDEPRRALADQLSKVEETENE